MRGIFYIDGVESVQGYGMTVAQYGYRQLIQMPGFKQLDTTEWDEEDGVEVDLTDPQLEARTLQIEFNMTNIRYAEDLFDELSQGSYHEFYFPELEKTYTLRMLQNGKFSSCVKKGILTLTFADDFPELPTGNHYAFGKTDIRQWGYEMDGVDFSQFGTWVLEGTDDSIRKAADIKQNLKVSTKNTSGVLYDGSHAFFKAKDVQIRLLINTPGIKEFWKRYNSLFALLLQPESRMLFYNGLQTEYECHYKTSSVSRFDILSNGKVWCEFSITLTFTNYRPTSQYMLLAHEDYDLVLVDVSGAETFIRIRPKRGISMLSHMSGEFVDLRVGGKDAIIYLNN